MTDNEVSGQEKPLKTHYQQLHKKCKGILVETFDQDEDGSHPEAESFVKDLECWHSILEGRTEGEVIEQAIREYQSALFALAQGMYRHAFMALRLHFELTLNAIYLSSHEKRLRKWKSGMIDTKWHSIIDKDDGLFSEDFASVFNEPLEDDVLRYQSLAFKVYKECSRYVHGNFNAEIQLPGQVSFEKEIFELWHNKADTVREIITFSFCLRYLQDLTHDERHKVSGIVRDQLGHVKPIQAQIS
jgi:hypothetical protein